MYQVGLTGGIGSGKTLVCSVLEKLGVAVYYADREARRVMNDDPALIARIVELFGEKAYNEQGLDRQYLAGKVFGNPALLDKLNQIVHPVVRKDYSRWVALQHEASYVVEEAAILFESGADRFMDFNILVYAPEELRIRRVMLRDHLGEKEIRSRISHQMGEKEKLSRADYVIYNDEKEMLLPQIVAMHHMLVNRS